MNDELKVMIGNLFSNLPDQIDKESFETIISSESLRIERIISKDHRSPEDGGGPQNLDNVLSSDSTLKERS